MLRHQLIVLRRRVRGRAQPTNNDRWFLVQMYRWFPSILKAVTIVQPETLVRWHRTGFRRYWGWKSNLRGGRPRIEIELRALIRQAQGEGRDLSPSPSSWGRASPRGTSKTFASCSSAEHSDLAKLPNHRLVKIHRVLHRGGSRPLPRGPQEHRASLDQGRPTNGGRARLKPPLQERYNGLINSSRLWRTRPSRRRTAAGTVGSVSKQGRA